jgi:hypothetical protein
MESIPLGSPSSRSVREKIRGLENGVDRRGESPARNPVINPDPERELEKKRKEISPLAKGNGKAICLSDPSVQNQSYPPLITLDGDQSHVENPTIQNPFQWPLGGNNVSNTHIEINSGISSPNPSKSWCEITSTGTTHQKTLLQDKLEINERLVNLLETTPMSDDKARDWRVWLKDINDYDQNLHVLITSNRHEYPPVQKEHGTPPPIGVSPSEPNLNAEISKIKTEKAREDIAKDIEVAERSLRLYNVSQTYTEDNNVLKKMVSEQLNDTLASNELFGATVHPLSKNLDKGSRPIAVTFSSVEKKSNFEKIIRERKDKTRTSYLWPKYLVKPVEDWRANLQKFSDDEFDLTDKLIMLRPTRDGRKISVKFKGKAENSKWTNFRLFDIPISSDRVKKDGLIQVNIPGFLRKTKPSPSLPGPVNPDLGNLAGNLENMDQLMATLESSEGATGITQS